MNLEEKEPISLDKKRKLLEMMEIYDERKKDYGIVGTRLQEHQAQVIPFIRDKVDIGGRMMPDKKWLLFQ